MDTKSTDEEDSMSKRKIVFLAGGAAVLAAALIVGCGSNNQTVSNSPPTASPGTVVTFGSDAPICDVESFIATITSASLVPQGGGSAVPLITATAPATVDFARLTDFTNILNTASVAPGTYSQLQMTLTNPQLIALNTSVSPPAPVPITPVTFTTTPFTTTITISPALVVTSGATTGLMMDLNLRKSLQVNGSGQVTGTVDPKLTVSAATTSGTTVGEATSLYGIVQSTTTSNLPSGFTGSFGLAVRDGTGQTFTILSNSATVFEGDGVTSFANLTTGTFVEVDAIVNTSGQIIAQIVDAEEQTSTASQRSAFLGHVIAVTRDGSGNATSFTLLVNDEIPDISGSVPLHSGLNVTLAGANYFTHWQTWNRQAFTFGPKTLGVGEKVAVHGVLGSGSPPALAARQVFLRPRNVLGNFKTLQAAGSDGKTGGFTMIPCGAIFGGQAITVVTYPDTNFTGVSGLVGLTAAPTLNTFGPLFYEQASGTTASGASWTAPAWVVQARGVHQLPN
jgi:hypothetical protein